MASSGHCRLPLNSVIQGGSRNRVLTISTEKWKMIGKKNGDTEERTHGISDNRLSLGPPFPTHLPPPSSHALPFLSLLTVNFCFVSQSRGTVEHDGEFLTTSFILCSFMSTESQCVGVWWGSLYGQGMLCLQLRGDTDIPESPCFLFKPERRQLRSKAQPAKEP